MKIRNRLVVSFFISTVVPCLLILITLEVYMHVRGTSLRELFDGPDEDFFRDATACILIVIALTGIVLVLWTYGSFVSRLNMLTKAAERIRNGDLDFEISSQGQDEIDQLADAFEEMRDRLKKNAEDLLKYEEDRRTLLSNIAHDLKGPITSINGYAEGILDGIANTDEKRIRYIRTIVEKAHDMNTLLTQLADFSRIETKVHPYDFEHVRAALFISDVLRPSDLELKNIGGSLSFTSDFEDDPEIIVDKDKIRRVINNIIGNSIKYRREEEPLSIEAGLSDAGDFVRLSFKDNGRGISKEDIAHVFERSFRGDASRNTRITGSGFGLSIVDLIIHDHGGKVSAASEEGQWTEIAFTLKKYEKGEGFGEDTDN